MEGFFTPTTNLLITIGLVFLIGLIHFLKEREIWHREVLNLWEWLITVTTPLPLTVEAIVYEKIPFYWFFVIYFFTFLLWIIIGLHNRNNLEPDEERIYDRWLIIFPGIFLYLGMYIFSVVQSMDVLELHMKCYFFETAKEWMLNLPHCT